MFDKLHDYYWLIQTFYIFLGQVWLFIFFWKVAIFSVFNFIDLSCSVILLLFFKISGTSLVTQWLRIRLPMQGTRVWALVREDPSCRRATKPISHNYWACMPQLLKPTRLEPVLLNKRSHHTKSSPRLLQLEKAHVQQWRHNAA